MKNLNRMLIMLWLSLALIPSEKIFAQGPPPSGDRLKRWEEREKIRENIETLRMWKLIEVLDLTSEQSTQFLPILKDFRDARKKFEDRRREFLKDLETTLESKKDEKKLKESLDSLENNRREFQINLEKFIEKTKTTLTLEQQAKLLLFEEKFEKRVRETIEQIRGKRTGGND